MTWSDSSTKVGRFIMQTLVESRIFETKFCRCYARGFQLKNGFQFHLRKWEPGDAWIEGVQARFSRDAVAPCQSACTYLMFVFTKTSGATTTIGDAVLTCRNTNINLLIVTDDTQTESVNQDCQIDHLVFCHQANLH